MSDKLSKQSLMKLVELRGENEELKAQLAALQPEEFAKNPSKFCDCVCHKTGVYMWGCCRCSAIGKTERNPRPKKWTKAKLREASMKASRTK